MSRPLTWAERRQRLLDQVHAQVIAAQAIHERERATRFAFVCGRAGCEKPYGHAGAHGREASS